MWSLPLEVLNLILSFLDKWRSFAIFGFSLAFNAWLFRFFPSAMATPLAAMEPDSWDRSGFGPSGVHGRMECQVVSVLEGGQLLLSSLTDTPAKVLAISCSASFPIYLRTARFHRDPADVLRTPMFWG
jgi:hypothetical protein